MKLAVPSDAPGGLDAKISEHFGHCSAFTLVQIDEQQIGEITIVPNEGHEQGGCLAPVNLLKERGADSMVAGGMGMRPLMGFQQVGITVYFKDSAATVREAAEMIIAGKGRPFGEQHTCGGHEGGCGGHDHHQPEPVHVDGPITPQRLVHISYELFGPGGEEVDRSDARYIHGMGQLAPGLEQALTGHVAGDHLEVTLEPEQAYGPRDETRLVEIPRDKLPDGVSQGETLHSRMPNGTMIPMTVVTLTEDKATLDANHPLAGKQVTFKVDVKEVFDLVSPEDKE